MYMIIRDFYHKRLKGYWLMRQLARTFWFVRKYLIFRAYRLIRFTQFLEASGTARIELLPARVVDVSLPNEISESHGSANVGSIPLSCPAVFAFELASAQIMGGGQCIFTKKEALCDDLRRFDMECFIEEYSGQVSISPPFTRLIRSSLLYPPAIRKIPAAIHLVFAPSFNYAHWIFESLPKLALVDELDAYDDMPIIIDAGLHPNILESVHLMNSRGRALIELPSQEVAIIERALIISPVSYTPLYPRKGANQNYSLEYKSSHFAIHHPDALMLVRRKLFALLGEPVREPGKRVFLRRTGNLNKREMTNAAEIEALLLRFGFEVVSPETLSFAEQVRLFASAEMIVAEAGAALVNIMFAPSGCKIVMLSFNAPFSKTAYFSNVSALLGQHFTGVMGEAILKGPDPEGLDTSFYVPLNILEKVILNSRIN